MSISRTDDGSPPPDEPSTPERCLATKLSKINAVLMDRVERSMDAQGNAFSLFQTAIALEAKVRGRTEELTSVLRRLERSNEALVVAKEEAERANLSKTRFLTAASHDLLQPLNAARLSISVLSEMQNSGEAQGLAGQIDRALQALEDLIKTLLDISKLDAGVVQPEVKIFPLDEVLSVLEANFQPLAAAKQLKFRVRHCGLLVKSDSILLLRVLQNLVSNAVRYTARGGVLVGVRRLSDFCLIYVIDTGNGIAESEREAIFDEFYRGAAASASGHTGLGLGLSIVRRTVQALGHPLVVASQIGKGSVFRLTVPSMGVAPILTSDVGERRESADGVADAVVLLIENDQNVIDATIRLLDRWSCHALTARRPCEIGPLLANLDRPPDIVIADYHLDRGQTGLAVVAELRPLLGPDLPAVIVTADHSEAVAAEVRAAGCELIHKPFKPAELRSLVAHLLKQRIDRSPNLLYPSVDAEGQKASFCPSAGQACL